MDYSIDIRRSLFHGDTEAAMAYFRRAQEKGGDVDVKDVLRVVVMGIVTTQGRIRNEGTLDTVAQFAQEAGVDFQINNELQPMIETVNLGGHLKAYVGELEARGAKPKRDIERVVEFARAHGVELNFQTPQFQMNLQKCQDAYIELLAGTILAKYAASTEGRAKDVERFTNETLPEPDQFAEEQGLRLDWKVGTQKVLYELTKEGDINARRLAAQTLVEQSQQRGYGLDASFDRLYLDMLRQEEKERKVFLNHLS